MEIVKVSDDVAYCEQPSFQQMRALHRAGFETLVNVRLPAEQPIPEQPQAERLGFHYVQLPIAQPEWSEEVFDRFRELTRSHKGRRMLVHSAEGARAGILALTEHAAEVGWTVDELEVRARTLGLELPDAARAWLRRHSLAYDNRPSSAR